MKSIIQLWGTPKRKSSCITGCNNYTNITEPTRSVDTKSNKSSLCDKGVFTGNSWIRFTGSGGTTIPEYAPEPDHCGTENPGWVQGDHPSVAEGIVQRELCFRLNQTYCHFRYNVSIRNCGTFYVYKPPDILQCQLRICTSVGMYAFFGYCLRWRQSHNVVLFNEWVSECNNRIRTTFEPTTKYVEFYPVFLALGFKPRGFSNPLTLKIRLLLLSFSCYTFPCKHVTRIWS